MAADKTPIIFLYIKDFLAKIGKINRTDIIVCMSPWGLINF